MRETGSWRLPHRLGLCAALCAAMLSSPWAHWQTRAAVLAHRSEASVAAPSGFTLRPTGPGALQTAYLDVRAIQPSAPGRLRVGVLNPEGVPRADVVFLHGHADRLDNHLALFETWRAAGLRVIAFDWPSHGLSQVGPLDLYDTDDQIALIAKVERATQQDPQRPLFIAGWSFGGLVATRLLQEPRYRAALSRPPAGGVLLTPGVVVQPFVGGDGIARTETLVHAPYPDLAGPPDPPSPLLNPVFAGRVLATAAVAARTRLPSDLPVVVMTGGDEEDWYVNSRGILDWARQQPQSRPLVLQCEGARHGLDNEPYPIGPGVQHITAQFIDHVLRQQDWRHPTLPADTCRDATGLAP